MSTNNNGLDYICAEAAGRADMDADRVMARFDSVATTPVSEDTRLDMIDAIFEACYDYHFNKLFWRAVPCRN